MLIGKKSPHGGDIYTQPAACDFSANVNPFGMPAGVQAAVAAAAAECARYPDPYCGALRAAIAAVEGVGPEQVLCGNGAAELIYQFSYALPDKRPALILAPTFSEYETALGAAGIKAGYLALSASEGFRADERLLAAPLDGYGALFVCSPNNPTGLMLERETLEKLAKRCCEAGVRLFADLCFTDLSDQPDAYDLPALCREFPAVFLLKAFTKSYGMAGVRLGYGVCGDSAFLEKMSEKAPCWNVSTLAQQAGLAALQERDWPAKARALLGPERRRMATAFQEMGVTVFDSRANFLLLYSKLPLWEQLFARGFLTRDCSNYRGLGPGYLRVAVRLPEENSLLLSAAREVTREYGGTGVRGVRGVREYDAF